MIGIVNILIILLDIPLLPICIFTKNFIASTIVPHVKNKNELVRVVKTLCIIDGIYIIDGTIDSLLLIVV